MTARPVLRTASSSTAWTRQTCRTARRERPCSSTSWTRCRSGPRVITPSSAAPPGAWSTSSPSRHQPVQGQIGTYYQSDDLSGDRRPFVRFNPFNSNITGTGLLNPDEKSKYVSPLGDIGGPVLEDRLWFYAGAGRHQRHGADPTFTTDVTETQRHFGWWSHSKYKNYNVTGQVADNIGLKFGGSDRATRIAALRRRCNPTTAFRSGGLGLHERRAEHRHDDRDFRRQPRRMINQAAYDSRWVRPGGNQLNDTYSANFDWCCGRRSSSTSPPDRTDRQRRRSSSGVIRSAIPLAART